MKKTFFFVALVLILFVRIQSVSGQSPLQLSLPEAEKIMGEPARLTDSSSAYQNGAHNYRCSYTGLSKDSITGRIGKLYYMYEEYDKISDAQKFYTQIKAANAKNNVLKDLAMGDEAYSQDDTVHLRFIMARKGNKILRFKINKVTRWTSTDGLMDVARMMSSKL